MALYVKDEEVDRLAEEVQAAYGVKTKTEAVKIALKRALEQPDKKAEMMRKLEAVQARIRLISDPDPDFDEKAYTDMMWGV
jgi:antitoxin VapB